MAHFLRSMGPAVALMAGLLALPGIACAADFLSVAEPAVLYDSPSDKGKPLFIVQRYTPVEVVVNLEGWVKVRESEGTVAWVQKSALSPTRMVIATTQAQVRQAADPAAPILYQVDKAVALELLEIAPPGWARVKHRDGQEGLVRVEQVWGL